MAKNHADFMKRVNPKIRKAAEKRAKQIILGQVLRSYREGRRIPQATIAAAMGLKQPAIARLEKQSDVKLSTLRAFAKSFGAELVVGIRHEGEVFDLLPTGS